MTLATNSFVEHLERLKGIDPSLVSEPDKLKLHMQLFGYPTTRQERVTQPVSLPEEKAVEISSETVVTDESSFVGIPRFFKSVYGAEPDHKTELFKAVRNRFVGAFDKEPKPGTVFVPTRFSARGKEVKENQYPTEWLRTELEKIRVTNPCHWKLCDA